MGGPQPPMYMHGQQKNSRFANNSVNPGTMSAGRPMPIGGGSANLQVPAVYIDTRIQTAH